MHEGVDFTNAVSIVQSMIKLKKDSNELNEILPFLPVDILINLTEENLDQLSMSSKLKSLGKDVTKALCEITENDGPELKNNNNCGT